MEEFTFLNDSASAFLTFLQHTKMEFKIWI